MSVSTLDLIRFSREGLLSALDGLTPTQINRVPQGHKNNLAWQVGHVIVTEQLYLYRKAGLPIHIDEAMIDLYGNGTVPTKELDQNEIDQLKALATSGLDKIKADRAAGVFTPYQPFTITAKQLPVNTIDDALKFILFHEGLHLGAARLLKNVVC